MLNIKQFSKNCILTENSIKILDIFEAAVESWVEWVYLYKGGQWYGTNVYLKNPHVLRSIPQLLKITEDDWDEDMLKGTIEDLKQDIEFET